MIPSTNELFTDDLEDSTQPTKTYKLDLSETGTHATGLTDGIEAVKQAVFRILNTERYKWAIYPWSYGIELHDLFGQPASYVCPELERRIQEALTMDDRITSVDSFTFDLSTRHVVRTAFTVHTIYGDYDDATEAAY